MKASIYILLSALILVGCAGPKYRIKKNMVLFTTYSAEVQEDLRQGRIKVGYTDDMVFMAFGKPSRKYERRAEDGLTEVWSYAGRQHQSDRQRVNGRFRIRDADGQYRTVYDTVWVDVDRTVEFERLRIELRGGKVVAIENVKP